MHTSGIHALNRNTFPFKLFTTLMRQLSSSLEFGASSGSFLLLSFGWFITACNLNENKVKKIPAIQRHEWET